MPYIGRGSDGFGIRERYQYTATSGQTAFTGSDINSKTLKFDNGSLIDVFLNGLVLKPTEDYNTSTANTITLTSGASTSDEVMIIVYDVFALSDALPKSGGTVSGALVAEGGVTFNEGSNDVDFRVESNGDANMLFVDGGNNRVGIGTGTPAEALEVKTSSSPAIQLNQGGSYQGIIRLAGNDLEIRGSGGALELYNGANDGDSSSLALKIDASGHVTKPLQPAFLVKPDANQDSLAINTYHTVQFDEEKFDQNGDFNTTNYTFTAPVTGRYQLNTQVYLYSVDEAADYYLVYIDTSNNDYQVILDPGGYDGDINYQSWVISTLADMDASDTAVVKVYQQAGSQQVNLISGGYTWFSGYLVA